MTQYGAELVETVARAIERTSHDSDEDFAEAWAQWNVRHNRTVEARAALAAACAKAPHMTLAQVQREIGE